MEGQKNHEGGKGLYGVRRRDSFETKGASRRVHESQFPVTLKVMGANCQERGHRMNDWSFRAKTCKK